VGGNPGIKRHIKGIDISKLKDKTGIHNKEISKIALELSKQGKIKRDLKGLYVKA